MSQYGATRFGWSSPSRIAGTTMMLADSDVRIPGEAMYQPLIPFYPASPSAATSSGSSTSQFVLENGRRIWQAYPAYTALIVWQGDDVIITMYFRDAENPTMDMSGDTWTGEIRTCHDYTSTLIAELPCAATYTPPAFEGDLGVTKVEMFFPRQSNLYCGRFHWELRSVSDTDLSRFPQPADVEVWPPDSMLRSWLFGPCYILPRTGATDVLIDDVPDTLPPVGGYILNPFVGPNGRVP